LGADSANATTFLHCVTDFFLFAIFVFLIDRRFEKKLPSCEGAENAHRPVIYGTFRKFLSPYLRMMWVITRWNPMILEPTNIRKPKLSSVWLDRVKQDFPEEVEKAEEEFFSAFEWKLAHKRRLRRMQSQGAVVRTVTNLFENLGWKAA
jgi:hypothetical protein